MSGIKFDRWPGRYFKCGQTQFGASAFVSPFDVHHQNDSFKDFEMIAVPIPTDPGSMEASLEDDILNSRAPFNGFDYATATNGVRFIVARFRGRFAEFQMEQNRS